MAIARRAGNGFRRAPANTTEVRKESRMNRNDIAAAIARMPDLNDFGATLSRDDRKLQPDQRAAKLRELQDELLDAERACTKVCEWLEGMGKIKSINRGWNSYGLKHLFSDQANMPYVTNGQFIAAAIHCGFEFEINPIDASVSFNISERSIKEAEKSRDTTRLPSQIG
jgi:hypothetical protein